jgi:maleylpyruvate isomerase
MLTLYSYWRSSSAYRVRIMLAWKALDYEYIAVDIAPGHDEQKEPAFSRINPLQQVPTLLWQEHGHSVQLTQSVAIAEYLEETHPRPALLPKDPLARARVRELVEIVNSGIQPLQNAGVLVHLHQLGGEAAAQRWTQEAITRGLHALEAHAKEQPGPWLAGSLSLAEVFLVPQLANARRYGVDLTPFARLREAEAAALTVRAFIVAHPDRQPDAPHGAMKPTTG